MFKKIHLLLVFMLGIGSASCKQNTAFDRGVRDYGQYHIEKEKKPTRNIIVLLHGLGSPNGSDPLADYLKTNFSDAHFINPKRYNSINASMLQQAEELYKTLADELKKYNQVRVIPHVYLVGYSQGGVLAATFFNLYKDKCKAYEASGKKIANHLKIKVKGVITINSPLCGTRIHRSPLLNGIRTILNNQWTRLTLGVLGNVEQLEMVVNGVSTIGEELTKYATNDGVRDLSAGSACITTVQHVLNTAQIPVVVIGSSVGLKEAIPGIQLTPEQLVAIDRVFKNINGIDIEKVVNDIVTGSEYTGHDGLVPIDSQLADPVYNTHISRITMENPCHHNQVFKTSELYRIIHTNLKGMILQAVETSID